jgi:OOP family OmpA-OmpF porin
MPAANNRCAWDVWHNQSTFLVMVTLIVLITQRGCGFFPKRRTMKKLNKVAMLFASAALATAAGAQTIDNWRNGTSELVWKNGTNELCWRDANWTPATAAAWLRRRHQGCPLRLRLPAAAPAPAPAPAPALHPPAPRPAPAPQPPAATKVTYAADAFFDFDKSVLKPEGKAKLDDLVGKVKGINLEVIIAVGHTDSVGSDAYNQKLSVRRAEAVKAYLVSKGIEKNRVYTEGKGEKQPVADNKTKPKAAPRTVAWKSKWSVPAPTSNPRIAAPEKAPATGLFSWPRQNTSHDTPLNADPAELAKFSDLAHRWWDPDSEFRPCTRSTRCGWTGSTAWPLAGKRVLDVGCGGGILADAMARRAPT